MEGAALDALKGPPQGHGPLGSMRQDGLPVHLRDVGEHAKAFGFPPKHPPMRELLGQPVFCGTDVRGALYVTDHRGRGSFTDAHAETLRALSRHAGLIIDASWY
jgi:GAF domain-containing protein